MALYRSMGRGSWIVERTLLGVHIRKATGAFDRREASCREQKLVALARNGRIDILRRIRDGFTSVVEVCNAVPREAAGIARRSRPTTSVYFAQIVSPVGDDPIKIGIGRHVGSRLQGLRTALPYDLTLLRAVRGDATKERAIHRRFAHSRICGEWFRPTAELLEFIRKQAHLEPWEWA